MTFARFESSGGDVDGALRQRAALPGVRTARRSASRAQAARLTSAASVTAMPRGLQARPFADGLGESGSAGDEKQIDDAQRQRQVQHAVSFRHACADEEQRIG
ncbi:MAG: hypothetical protein D6744_08340 [Planctomycetota bacterium]|nr:MAG: hypothetical protein D6744_08340 [Planctomycetota bacterium]